MLHEPHKTTVCAWLKTVVLQRESNTLSVDAPCSAQHHDGGRVQAERESSHVEAARALHIHEEGVWRLHKALELVAAQLKLTRRVQQIDIAHGDVRLPSPRARACRVSGWLSRGQAGRPRGCATTAQALRAAREGCVAWSDCADEAVASRHRHCVGGPHCVSLARAGWSAP